MAQVDLCTAILCTRVSKSMLDDWEKLSRLLHNVKHTITMKRVLGGTEELERSSTYVDASYAIHMDMKGHTGGLVSLGMGTIHTKSSTQKINTKSLTESEVIGAIDFITWTMWLKRTLMDIGYGMKRTLLYQDNESAIKMEKNGLKYVEMNLDT